MAVAYSSAGAGVSTETSGAALSPACPATVNPGDILILHVAWEGTSDAPSPPSEWTLLSGPQDVGSAAVVARHWVYGKIAVGTEDGATIACGAPAVTTQRGARIYSFSGRVDGTIEQLTGSFSAVVGDTDPTGPTVTTTAAGGLAVALCYQNDNNTLETYASATGGTWTEDATYTPALNAPGLAINVCTCTPTSDPGQVSGGAMTVTNDPWGVVGFEIRPFAASAYRNLIAGHSSLRAYYRLGEARGTTLDDSGPNNLDGTHPASGITYAVDGATVGDDDTAVTYDASADGSQRADDAALDLGDGPLSVEFWLKRGTDSGASEFLVHKAGTGAYGVFLNASDLVVFQSVGVGNIVASTTTITDLTTWHHVVVTKAAGGGTSATKLYIDGVDRTGTVTDRTLADTASPLRLAGTTGSRFPGSLDEVALYAAVLTPTEVLQHYEAGIAQHPRTLTPGTETDAAQGLTKAKRVTLTAVAETDAAQALSFTQEGPQHFDLIAAAETDAAQALNADKKVSLAPAAETDVAQALGVPQDVTLTPASETDAAQGLNTDKRASLAVTAETDAAQTLTAQKAVGVTLAAETDAAPALSFPKHVSLTPATEAEAGQALVVQKHSVLAPAAETDAAQVLDLGGPLILGPALETDTAQALSVTKTIVKSITPASESNAAEALTAAKSVSLTSGSETDAAEALDADKQVTLGVASETDTARMLVRQGYIASASETDEAQALSYSVLTPPGGGGGGFKPKPRRRFQLAHLERAMPAYERDTAVELTYTKKPSQIQLEDDELLLLV